MQPPFGANSRSRDLDGLLGDETRLHAVELGNRGARRSTGQQLREEEVQGKGDVCGSQSELAPSFRFKN
jgi:hypothetical protein